MGRGRKVLYGEVVPTHEQVGEALSRYLLGRAPGESAPGAAVEWREAQECYVATLPGAPADAWLRPLAYPTARARFNPNDARWFEVWLLDPAHIDVVTRSADDLTNAVADGFARACAYAFGTHKAAQEEEWWAGAEPAARVAEARAAAADALRRLALAREEAASASPFGGVGSVCRANRDLGAAIVESHREVLQLREELAGSPRPPTVAEARAVRKAGGFYAWSDGHGRRGTVVTSRRAKCVHREARHALRWFAVGARDGARRSTLDYAALDVGGEIALSLWQRLRAAERRAEESADGRVARLTAAWEAAVREVKQVEAALAGASEAPPEGVR